jgi:uncharacterized protein (DUF1330 family)
MDQLPVQWNELATRGDLRTMAIRLDSRFSRIDTHINTLEASFKIPKDKVVGYDSGIMSESPVHFIAHFTINDADKYRVYEKGFFPILKAHNGTFLTYDDNVAILEGTSEAGRTVVIQFESEAACMTWWNSPEYRELATHRHAGTTTHSISVVHAIKR